MAFTIPSLDDDTEFLVGLFKHLFADADVSEGSPNWLWCKTQAAGVAGNHAHLAAVENDLLPDTAVDDLLDRWGTIRGVPRKGATPARKSAALRFFGTPATVVPNGAVLVHSSGLRFETASSAPVGAGGYVDVDVAAIDVGSDTRLSAGEDLTLSVPVAGLQDVAELQLAMDEDGTDVESNGDYRVRVLSRFSAPPLGGAANDYVQWALDVTGIAAAFCYPLRAGIGTVDLAALHAGSGTERLLQAGEITSLQATIDAERPVGVKAFRVLTVTASAPVAVEYTVIPNGDLQHAFDWDDSAPPVVLAWNAGTRVLQFTGGTRPSTLQPGDRIMFSGGATGAERVVESLSGADSVVLQNDPAGDTPAGTAYSGGPLVAPIRAAIQALADGLGPANPDTSRFGPWEGNLRPGAINRVASAIAGVLDGTVVAPVATVAANNPAYPDDGTVELLVLGQILVHQAH